MNNYRQANPAMTMLKKARARSMESGMECTITGADITIPTVCPVLGIPLIKTRGTVSPGTPSLDRIDNSRGYVPGNIRVISYRANSLKSDASAEELHMVAAYAASIPSAHLTPD